MDTNKIPEAERLFRQLGTYQKMKSMLEFSKKKVNEKMNKSQMQSYYSSTQMDLL